jgi:N-acetylneuraminate lyase
MDSGANGIYCCGSTSEAFLLTTEERKQVAETCVSVATSRVPVVVHVGHISAATAADLAQHADAIGADAVSAIPPFYYDFSVTEVIDYYSRIAKATDLPLVVYNFPEFSGVSLTDDRFARLFQEIPVQAIKNTSSELYEIERLKRHQPAMTVLHGRDETLLSALALGIRGAVGSTFSVLSSEFNSLMSAFEVGQHERARAMQCALNDVIEVLKSVGVFQGIKHALRAWGIESNGCRAPFHALTRDQEKRIETAMARVHSELSTN